MTEAINNANSCNPGFELESPQSTSQNSAGREEQLATENALNIRNSNSASEATGEAASAEEQAMNWQKVAHKLREYNRKLLKKVFRLEQDLADIDNKFTKQIEASRSSDILIAQQEKDIRKYREEIELFDRRKADFLTIIEQKEAAIADLSQRHQLSQQKFAQLERDCALLQENSNHQAYELNLKNKEIRDLQDKLNQQQRTALQYKVELQRYKEQPIPPAIPIKSKEPAIIQRKTSYQKTIKPWSAPAASETKTTLPKSKSKTIEFKQATPTNTIKTTAQIATWSASEAERQKAASSKKTKGKPPASVKVKPQSLAAVDLPTFPRPL
ncbi:MAG: hypothetical protein AAGE96_02975 [Cyanobacteria bacterium P01_G01_bin.19]